jgi:hypothetical protein
MQQGFFDYIILRSLDPECEVLPASTASAAVAAAAVATTAATTTAAAAAAAVATTAATTAAAATAATTTAAAAATATILRLVYVQCTTTKISAIHCFNGSLRVLIRTKGDKSKTTATAGVPVGDYLGFHYLTMCFECFAKRVIIS